MTKFNIQQAVQEAATICPRPLQQKRAAAALSQAGQLIKCRWLSGSQCAYRNFCKGFTIAFNWVMMNHTKGTAECEN